MLVATLALVLRALVVAAYRPALMYLGDSGAYLDQAWHGHGGRARPGRMQLGGQQDIPLPGHFRHGARKGQPPQFIGDGTG